MAFPDRPDFNAGGDESAWWRIRGTGQQVFVCRTSGNTFVRLLQDMLRAGGASDVVSDAIWGPATQRALATQLATQGAPSILVQGAQAAARPGALARGAEIPTIVLNGAIWLLHRAGIGPVPAGTDATNIVAEPDLRGPRWLQAPPLTGIPVAGIFCSVLGIETPGLPPETPGEPPTNATPPPSGAPPASTPLPPMPPGVNVPPPARAESSVKWGYVAALGAVVAVVGALALSEKRGSRKGRR